jgi:hypothetical protein
MDDLYESAEDFDALNAAIADRLLAACKTGDVVYAVPGGGTGEALGRLALRAKKAGITVDIFSGTGFAQAAMAAAGQTGDRLVVAAANSLPETLNPFMPLAIEELDTRIRAGEVKLALLEYYPDEHPVRLCVMGEDGAICSAGASASGAGQAGGRLRRHYRTACASGGAYAAFPVRIRGIGTRHAPPARAGRLPVGTGSRRMKASKRP